MFGTVVALYIGRRKGKENESGSNRSEWQV
jgi:hypothetical protein